VRRLRRAGAPLATATLCLALAVTASPPATGDPGGGHGTKGGGAAAAGSSGRAFPSQRQVDAARARAAGKARDVGEIQTRLLLADQQLEAASLRAEQASEDYNGARWRLAEATTAYRRARGDAARARRAQTAQRSRIGAVVAQSYQDGGDLTALRAMVGADGPEGVLDQYAAFQGASTSLQADYQRFAATDALARVYEAKAHAAKTEQTRLAARARAAQQQAATAADAAQSEAATVAVEKDRLVADLARAQHISVSLARSRQSALAQIARRRAEERARQAALAAARGKARDQARARAVAQARQREAARAAAGARAQGRHHPVRSGAPAHAPAPAPVPAPAPAPAPAPPPTGGGAAQAIAFAKAQLGEPYQWGAAGPGSWDCSGLTMAAWGSAGRSLAHYTVSQYESTTHISVSQLRPGDLVFWSSNGAPSGIHHVAMYIGNGQIIHAPRTGRPVEIDDMYYWIPPNFFGRV